MADQRIIKVLNDVRVTNTIDFTASEPASPTVGDTYINTTTGTSSATSQSMTANYIYTYNSGGTWDEVVPNAGFSAFHVAEVDDILYTGSEWVPSINYSVDNQRIYFASGATAIIPHSSTLDMNGDGFSVLYSIAPGTISGTHYICHKETGGVGWGIYQSGQDLYVRYDDNVNDDSAINATNSIYTGGIRTFMTIFDPQEGHGQGQIKTIYYYYHLGHNRVYSYNADIILPLSAGSVDSASNLFVGSNVSSASSFVGSWNNFIVMNYAVPVRLMFSVYGSIENPGILLDSTDNSEMLSQGDFTTTTKWAATGDWTLGSGVATLAWSADQTSTLTQTNANLVSDLENTSLYVLRYDVTTTQTTGTLTLTVTPSSTDYSDGSGYGNNAVTMPIITGRYERVFSITGGGAGSDFVITAVSSGGAAGDSTVIDNLTLKKAGAVVNLGADSLVA